MLGSDIMDAFAARSESDSNSNMYFCYFFQRCKLCDSLYIAHKGLNKH